MLGALILASLTFGAAFPSALRAQADSWLDFGTTLRVIDGPVMTAWNMTYSPSGDIIAEIVYCGLGQPGDFPVGGLNGKIALIQRGILTFKVKTDNAYSAGASAAIIYNNVPGELRGTLGSPTQIPAVGISQSDGTTLLALLANGPVTVHLVVNKQVVGGIVIPVDSVQLLLPGIALLSFIGTVLHFVVRRRPSLRPRSPFLTHAIWQAFLFRVCA